VTEITPFGEKVPKRRDGRRREWRKRTDFAGKGTETVKRITPFGRKMPKRRDYGRNQTPQKNELCLLIAEKRKIHAHVGEFR